MRTNYGLSIAEGTDKYYTISEVTANKLVNYKYVKLVGVIEELNGITYTFGHTFNDTFGEKVSGFVTIYEESEQTIDLGDDLRTGFNFNPITFYMLPPVAGIFVAFIGVFLINLF